MTQNITVSDGSKKLVSVSDGTVVNSTYKNGKITVSQISPAKVLVQVSSGRPGQPGLNGTNGVNGIDGIDGKDGTQSVFYGTVQPDFKGMPGIWIENLGGGNFTFWFEDGL